MLAILILLFIAFCVYWFLRSVNRMLGIIKPKNKPVPFVHKAEEVKPDATPTVTNIQNNYNTTIIIEAPKDK